MPNIEKIAMYMLHSIRTLVLAFVTYEKDTCVTFDTYERHKLLLPLKQMFDFNNNSNLCYILSTHVYVAQHMSRKICVTIKLKYMF